MKRSVAGRAACRHSAAVVDSLEQRTLLTTVTPLMADRSWETVVASVDAGGRFYFMTANATTGQAALWVTDGTTAGTLKLKTFAHDPAAPEQMWVTNNTLLFSANDGSRGQELWTSNGTAAGTVLLKSINSGGRSAAIGLASANLFYQSFFWADDGVHGRELWRTDGTAAGTALVKDINPGSASSVTDSPALVRVGTSLYFPADDGPHGVELWRTDGTSAGTVLVKDIAPGLASSNPTNLTEFGGTLIFGATNGTDTGPYRSDGTRAGTGLLVRLLQVPAGPFVPLSNGRLIFSATDSTATGEELWQTNGTPAGTSIVTDLTPNIGVSTVPQLWSFGRTGSVAYFTIGGPRAGVGEVWQTDGTAAGTKLVFDFITGTSTGTVQPVHQFDSELTYVSVVRQSTSGTTTELWQINGSTVTRIKSFAADPARPNIQQFVETGGAGFFLLATASNGLEPWTTNGTSAGTVLVKDVNAGTADGAQELFASNSVSRQMFWGNTGNGWRMYVVGASATPLTITGTAGADVVTINVSATTITYVVNGVTHTRSLSSTSSVIVDLGAGDDRLSAGGVPVNMVVQGGDGNDTITTGSGNDSVQGGSGDDQIATGDGNDTIYGQFGNDSIDAGAGDDSVLAGLGNDTLFGGEGNDTIFGGDGQDSITAGAGDDYVEGKGKADTISGGHGDDTIYGGAGSDSILGGAGNDWLFSSLNTAFADTIEGGPGVDRFEADANDTVINCEVNLLA